MSGQLSESVYITIIPFEADTAWSATHLIQLNGLRTPFSYDLPDYSIFLTDEQGDVSSYRRYIKEGKNKFTSSVLNDVSFECTETGAPSANSECTLSFATVSSVPASSSLHI